MHQNSCRRPALVLALPISGALLDSRHPLRSRARLADSTARQACSWHQALGISQSRSNPASPLFPLCGGPCTTATTCSLTAIGDRFHYLRLWLGALQHGASEPLQRVAPLAIVGSRCMLCNRQGPSRRGLSPLCDQPRGAHWASGLRWRLYAGMPHTADTACVDKSSQSSFLYM